MQCMKSVQIRSFFWPVFPRIRTEYGEKSVFGHFSRSAALEAASLLQLRTKHLEQSKEIQQNWTRLERFDFGYYCKILSNNSSKRNKIVSKRFKAKIKFSALMSGVNSEWTA